MLVIDDALSGLARTAFLLFLDGFHGLRRRKFRMAPSDHSQNENYALMRIHRVSIEPVPANQIVKNSTLVG